MNYLLSDFRWNSPPPRSIFWMSFWMRPTVQHITYLYFASGSPSFNLTLARPWTCAPRPRRLHPVRALHFYLASKTRRKHARRDRPRARWESPWRAGGRKRVPINGRRGLCLRSLRTSYDDNNYHINIINIDRNKYHYGIYPNRKNNIRSNYLYNKYVNF